MSIVIVAGVPGTGKSVVGSKLAKLLGYDFESLTLFVLERGLWCGYDWERRSFIIDYEALVKRMRSELAAKNVVLDCHWVEPVADAGLHVERVVLLRTRPDVLAKRLLRRGWPRRKVAENVEAELLGIIAKEVLEVFGISRVYEINTTSKRVEDSVREALEAVRRGLSRCCIDWLEVLEGPALEEVLRMVEFRLMRG